ncbi:MAG TPA: L-asparaginase, partial [Corynebacterium variabile]
MSAPSPVTLLATGGTIACTAGPDGALRPTRSAVDLCTDAGLTPDDVAASDALHLDSSEMTLADLDGLLAAIHAVGGPVVVTHGTD